MSGSSGNVVAISTSKRLMRVEEVAKYLSCSVSYVKKHAQQIPGLILLPAGARRVLRWDAAKLEGWQAEQARERA